jgi:error-prone DNA polymerase
VGWNNPPVPWKQLNNTLSWTSEEAQAHGDGGDAPGWSRVREPYDPPTPPIPEQTGDPVPYAELHCHSNFSFLDGASHPEEIIAAAAALRLDAVAITDHDGMYGVVRFSQAAKEENVPTVFGAELSLGLTGRQNGVADPEGSHLLAIARDPDGYRRLSRGISSALLASGEKGRPDYRLEAMAGLADDHWQILTGCRKGAVRQAIANASTSAGAWDDASAQLRRLVALFGRDNVAVELIDHGNPTDSEVNDLLAELAGVARLPIVATGNVHYAIPQQRRLATALAAVRARRSLDEMDGWLPGGATAHLRSGAEMAALFARYPGAVAKAAEYGRECAFDLSLVEPQLPPRKVPDGHTEVSYLRELTYEGARRKFSGKAHHDRAMRMIEHELAIIEKLGFPGYFLIVREIVDFCHQKGILCQGRGSAANSAVCFALGITAVDAVAHQLLFERFLAPERDGYPDIDLDIQSDRREEVIQDVYRKYGRQCAAQVANVITYRPKNAVRDIAKAFGYSQGQQDAWSKQIDHWGPLPDEGDHDIPAPVIEYANQLLNFPRHLGIHSGGMVLCDRPVSEVCPVEWATKENRTVVQWDKEDCADAKLVKFDLLGLGMLTALSEVMRLIREHHGETWTLDMLTEDDPQVYDMLCAADAVGVFQVESRAQLATLPRLKPRKFYDLVVEVALIRPGPIQGGSVHPYLRRRSGAEEITYPHKKLKKALKRTLGVPLFQEQLMQMAISIANFTASDADQLRRAMGSKRSVERMEELKEKLYTGMAANGITGTDADGIYTKLVAFSHFGFPESHALSFAKLVYASAHFKLFFPAAFCASLLNAQPMGFYSPQTLIADARRHGVTVRGVDVNASLAKAKLEPLDPGQREPYGTQAVRLGIGSVRTIGEDLAVRIEEERVKNGPYADMPELARRIGLSVKQTEALATAGAFECFGLTKREALWAAGAAAQERPDRLPGIAVGARPPMLPGMADVEDAMAEVWATGVSVDSYPTQFAREYLDSLGVIPAAQLSTVDDKTRVLVAGVVTHRQRPATAGGITFMNLEDETGMVNVVCSPGLWKLYRRVAHVSPALLVRGNLEKVEGVINVVATRLERLQLRVTSTSRNFR